MKFSKLLMILGLTAAMAIGLAACGGGDEGTPSPSPTVEATGAETVVIKTPKPEPKATVDQLVGSWVLVQDSKDWAKISKSGDKVFYQDKDAKYPATYANGKLTVTSDGVTLTATYDKDSKQMFITWSNDKNNLRIYKKK